MQTKQLVDNQAEWRKNSSERISPGFQRCAMSSTAPPAGGTEGLLRTSCCYITYELATRSCPSSLQIKAARCSTSRSVHSSRASGHTVPSQPRLWSHLQLPLRAGRPPSLPTWPCPGVDSSRGVGLQPPLAVSSRGPLSPYLAPSEDKEQDGRRGSTGNVNTQPFGAASRRGRPPLPRPAF